MKRLTPIERRAVSLIVSENQRILFSRNRRNAGGFIPQRITIEPAEARRMIRLNKFIASSMSWLGKKLAPRSRERAQFHVRLIFLRDTNRLIQRMLVAHPGRRAPLFITGREAEMYFSNLEIVHKVFRAFRMNYIESATDINRATEEAGQAWWEVRSIINVGHLPSGKRPESFGR